MSIRSFLTAGFVAAAVAGSASASIIVGWTIPTAFPTGTGNVPTGTSYLPPGPNGAGVANQGANFLGSELKAVKSVAASTYTSPAGNGSPFAFSANNWSPNDYFQAKFSTLGFTDINLGWDQARSSTGPDEFRVLMSVDGGTSFTELLAYTVLQSGGGGSPGTWSSTTYNPLYSYTLALGAAAENQSEVILRFQNFEAVASAATGSNRIDNILVTQGPVPAPGALALLGLAGLAARRRR
jgi:MYXO-CTERM domain-containing protein